LGDAIGIAAADQQRARCRRDDPRVPVAGAVAARVTAELGRLPGAAAGGGANVPSKQPRCRKPLRLIGSQGIDRIIG